MYLCMENKWKLGDDLRTYDVLLDGITFDDLILALHCNVPTEELTCDRIRAELEDTISIRREDMEFLLQNNMDEIVEYATHYYRDE